MTDYRPTIPEYSRITELVTYQDCVERALIYFNLENTDRDRYLAKQAVQNAMTDWSQGNLWKWLIEVWTLVTSAQYATGTIEYDHSTRTITLTDGTWPTDADWGSIRIESTSYLISRRVSDTEVTLREDGNPGADVESGTAYLWYRDTYPMPPDFWKMRDPVDVALKTGGPDMVYRDPEEVLSLTRAGCVVPVTCPQIYTFVRDPRRGCMVWMCSPPPSTSRTYQYVYHRLPRPLNVDKYSAGTIDTVAASTTVSGTGTQWTAAHKGCVIRISGNKAQEPTGQAGGMKGSSREVVHNPAYASRIVLDVVSATELTLDSSIDATLSGVKYTLSDPVDMDWSICSTFFQRSVEYEMACLAQDFQRAELLERKRNQEWHQAAAADIRDASINRRVRPWWLGLGLWADSSNVSTRYA